MMSSRLSRSATTSTRGNDRGLASPGAVRKSSCTGASTATPCGMSRSAPPPRKAVLSAVKASLPSPESLPRCSHRTSPCSPASAAPRSSATTRCGYRFARRELGAVDAVDEDEAAAPRLRRDERLDRSALKLDLLMRRGPERLPRERRDVRVLPVLLVRRREAQLLEAPERALAQTLDPRGLALGARPRIRGTRPRKCSFP